MSDRTDTNTVSDPTRAVDDTTPGFLIDLASRIHAKATPAMGFDGYDVDRLIEIARNLAEPAFLPCKSGEGAGEPFCNEDGEIVLRNKLAADFAAWLDPYWARALAYLSTPDATQTREAEGAKRLAAFADGGAFTWRDGQSTDFNALRADIRAVLVRSKEANRLALEDADALDRMAEEADDNGWQDWGAMMRQSAEHTRAALNARGGA